MELTLREITPADQNAVAKLIRAAFASPPTNENWTEEHAREMLLEWMHFAGFLGYVALEGPTIVGVLIGRLERWEAKRFFHLKELCVWPERQHTGIGSALLGHLERQLQQRNVAKLYVQTTRESTAHGFYRSCGFVTTEQLIVLSKPIPPGKNSSNGAVTNGTANGFATPLPAATARS
ncbi:N-acetyltransferase [Opitutaceae bacterium EW11]|nr:N-acetyltransferase [Opitutaceae bacterium EW11]